MTMSIQAEDLARQFPVDEVVSMGRHQSFEQSTEELNKKNGDIEKKSHPEDAVGSLAAIASIVWAQQPLEFKAYAKNQSGIDMRLGELSTKDSTQSSIQSIGQSGSEDQFKGDKSSLTPNQINSNKASLTFFSHFATAAKSTDIVSKLNSTILKSSTGATPSMSTPVAPVSKSELSSDAATTSVKSENESRESNLSIPNNVSPSLGINAKPSQGTQNFSSSQNGRHADAPDKLQSVSQVDLTTSAHTEKTGAGDAVKPNTDLTSSQTMNGRDLSDPNLPNSAPKRTKSKQEEAVESSALQSTMPTPVPNSAYPVAETVVQQAFTSSSSKRNADQANAAQSVKATKPEGIWYGLESWGAGKEVQITGTSQKGYVLYASDSDVKQVLQKNVDDSLPIVIASIGEKSIDDDQSQWSMKAIDRIDNGAE